MSLVGGVIQGSTLRGDPEWLPIVAPRIVSVKGDAVAENTGESNVPLSALSELSVAILEFERGSWPHHGAKEQAIRNSFDMGAARYYQLLNGVIDLPAAVQFDPILVRRLQHTRDARTAARASRRFTPND